MISLSETERQFIHTHLTADVRTLLLRKAPAGIDIRKLAPQIAARQKAREKLPGWYANDALIFPPSLSVEQASSEQTAHYKASLVDGQQLLDLTGGMGVDTWAFAKRVGHVTYAERNPELASLAAYNLPRLGALNCTVHTGDGLALSAATEARIDWIYLDPHRRDETGGKVVRLQDCEPDITHPQTLETLRTKANRILLKASPLLDIDLAVRQLHQHVKEVHIVAVQGEVKEVLFILDNQLHNQDDLAFIVVNLTAAGPIRFHFRRHEETNAAVPLGDPQTYIYEPNAAILKAGAFKSVAVQFGLTKLAPHSHLYTGTELLTNFPGRAFRLQQVIKAEAKTLRTAVPDLKANLAVRNFPQTVAELRKKLVLEEGGNIYIFATTLLNGDRRLLITQKAA